MLGLTWKYFHTHTPTTHHPPLHKQLYYHNNNNNNPNTTTMQQQQNNWVVNPISLVVLHSAKS